jgi:predicted PurR-regulated permease PerM
MRVRHNRRRSPTGIIIAGLLASLALAIWILRPFLVPLTWAAILVGVCMPWKQRLTALLRGRRRLAAVLACLLVSMVLVVPCVFLVIMLARESVNAYQQMQELLLSPQFESTVRGRWDGLVAWLFQVSGGAVDLQDVDLRTGLLEGMQGASGFLVALSSELMSRIFSGVLQLLLMIATMYFLFVHGPQLLPRLQSAIPMSHRQQRVLLRQFAEVSTVVLYGSFLTAVGQGLVGGLTFWALGLPSPLVWGAAMAAASIIPVGGSGLVWFPTAVYLLLSGEWVKGVVLIAIGFGVIGVVDNVVRIFILGGRMRMHILLVFLSIVGGLKAFGLLGLVLGPLTIVTLQTFFVFYETELRYPQRHGPHPARAA